MPRFLLLVAIVAVAVTIWALVDAASTPRDEVPRLPKPVWLVAIVLLPLVGGVAWVVATRGGGGSDDPRTAGPDDDPDFLRGLGRR